MIISKQRFLHARALFAAFGFPRAIVNFEIFEDCRFNLNRRSVEFHDKLNRYREIVQSDRHVGQIKTPLSRSADKGGTGSFTARSTRGVFTRENRTVKARRLPVSFVQKLVLVSAIQRDSAVFPLAACQRDGKFGPVSIPR